MILRLVLTLIFSAANAKAADENAREFRAMCWLYNLLTTAPREPLLEGGANGTTKTTLRDKINSIKTDILMLNLTLAENEVLATLKDANKYANQAATQEDGKKVAYFTGITQDKFAAMRKAHAKLFEEGQEGRNRRQAYNLPIPPALKDKLGPVFYQLEMKASKLTEELDFASNRLETERKAAAQAMGEAAFGTAYQPKILRNTILGSEIPRPPADHFPWKGSNRDDVCKTADKTTGKAGAALATDMLCICLPMSNSDSNNYCKTDPDKPTSSTAISTPEQANTEFEKIVPSCKKVKEGTTTTATPAALTATVGDIFSLLGKNRKGHTGTPSQAAHDPTEAAILGVHEFYQTKPACTANNAKPLETAGHGLCIDYNSLMSDPAGIPWVGKVADAEKHLNAVEHIFKQATQLIAQAEAVKGQMETLLLMGDLLKPTATAPAPGNKQPTVEEQNKCDKFKNNETDCTNNGCNYDSTKKECKPKAEAETTVTGTGETAKEGETTEKCKGKPEKDCTSPDCKWENNACKDSSILVNKKFALSVVSAAFVALLF
uniref:Variant surface glycoprotein 1125.33 n=1 Tax=Trypanosoma brucei TaxID=5691 RepID=A0A1J0R425_9TRYP|nr:variant surface glycoprotein 1125.33 [Trypanosoma brucei]